MKLTYTFISLIAFLATTTMAWSQETIQYPYNPDVDNDAFVATSDLQGFLAQFGQEFQPSPVLVDGEDLLSIIQMMQSQIISLQAQVATLEASSVPGLGDYVSVDESAHTVLVSGANLQVVNGSPSGQGYSNAANGKGNLILGYNVQGQDTVYARSGSHCLVMGRSNDYNSIYSIVHGRESSANGDYSAAIASVKNEAQWEFSAALGGIENKVGRDAVIVGGGQNNIEGGASSSVVVGGQSNVIGSAEQDNRYSVVVGGRFNKMLEDGYCGLIGGGYGNQILSGGQDLTNSSGDTRSIIGGRNNQSHGSNSSVMVGGTFDTMFPIDTVDSRGHVNLPVATFLGGIQPDNGSNTQVTGATPE